MVKKDLEWRADTLSNTASGNFFVAANVPWSVVITTDLVDGAIVGADWENFVANDGTTTGGGSPGTPVEGVARLLAVAGTLELELTSVSPFLAPQTTTAVGTITLTIS